MIILDSETQKPPLVTRAPSIVSTADSVSSSDVSPPSYRSRHSRHSLQPMYNDLPPSVSDVDADAPVKPKRRLRLEQGWCWKGLLYILAVYAVVSIAVAVPYLVSHHNNDSTSSMSYETMDGENNDSSNNLKWAPTAPPIIPPADGTVIHCNTWDITYAYGYPDATQSSRLTFWIPSNASSLWLHSIGKIPGLTSGQLSVILNPDDTQDQFLVSVLATYGLKDLSARNSTAICLLQSDQTDWGVGFYPSSPHSWNISLEYHITVYMPQIDDHTYTLSQFLINLPGFSHSFQNLQEYIAINNVNITGESSSVDGIFSANVININTTRGSITGNYSSSESLVLQMSSGAIDADITLTGGASENIPTNLSIQSTEGFISARITLANTSETSKTPDTSDLIQSDPPSFQADVTGEDTAMTIILNHADDVPFSSLDLNVNTTYSRALVLLDRNYQGSFALRSNNGSILVADIDATTNFNNGVLDGSFPSETYYRRSLDIRSYSPTELHGHVRRDDDDGRSSNSGQINVQVQNYFALVALGFFESGDPNPTISEMGLRL